MTSVSFRCIIANMDKKLNNASIDLTMHKPMCHNKIRYHKNQWANQHSSLVEYDKGLFTNHSKIAYKIATFRTAMYRNMSETILYKTLLACQKININLILHLMEQILSSKQSTSNSVQISCSSSISKYCYITIHH